MSKEVPVNPITYIIEAMQIEGWSPAVLSGKIYGCTCKAKKVREFLEGKRDYTDKEAYNLDRVFEHEKGYFIRLREEFNDYIKRSVSC